MAETPEKNELEQLRERLTVSPRLVWDHVDAAERQAIMEYAERYKWFLNTAKTEREAVQEIERLAQAKGLRSSRIFWRYGVRNSILPQVTALALSLGLIAGGGLGLRPAYRTYDALHRFGLQAVVVAEPQPCDDCRAGDVLRGVLRPDQCPHFRRRCPPAHPLGAPMVSSEGACAAYYQYRELT